MKNLNRLFCLFLIITSSVNAQNEADLDPSLRFERSKEILKNTDMSIPTSPAYYLLDASTSLVPTPSVNRNVKVDWAFRSYSLAPNFAIEIQPIWEALYNKPYLRKYRNDAQFQRMLSTLSVSVGAFLKELNNDSLRIVKDEVVVVPRETIKKWFMSMAVKMTLYRQYDPFLADNYYKPLETEYTDKKLKFKKELLRLRMQVDSTAEADDTTQLAVQKQIRLTELQEDDYERNHQIKLKDMRRQYQRDHWNGSLLEVGWGKIGRLEMATMIADSQAVSGRKLMNDGAGMWLSGCVGFGKSVLLSGMVRYIGDFEKSNRTSLGINFRYGSHGYNSYLETFYDIQPNVVKKANQRLISIGFGGDWRMNEILNLSFGLRTAINKYGTMSGLSPVVNLSCLMR